LKWQITFSDTARKQIAKLDRQARARVISFLDQRVASNPNPRSLGEALVGSKLGEYWRYRVGDYRVICEIQDERLVILAVAIGHRREIYR
jgi:mRNA interferase RelE/StbE